MLKASSMSRATGNAADLAMRRARECPDRPALVEPAPSGRPPSEARVTSYGALARRVAAYASGLARQGLRTGDRVAVLLPVGIDLYALTLALMASGLVAVFVESRRARALLEPALRETEARVVVSLHRLLRWRFVWPVLWGRRLFCADGSGLFLPALERLSVDAGSPLDLVDRDPDDVALVTFTSGSTDRPRAIRRTHGQLVAQARALDLAFPEPAGTVDLPAFPMAVLHNLACGDTTVLAPARAPAGAKPGPGEDPERAQALRLLDVLEEHEVTRLSGPPALLAGLVSAVEGTGRRLPALRRITVGGAPVSAALAARIRAAFPDARAFVLYGATEAEPIARADVAELLTARGDGYLAGKPTPGVEVRLEGAELQVRGPHVGRGDGVWHRTGDLGRIDEEGRIFLLGTMGSEVRHGRQVLLPFAVEAFAEQVADVRRAALVAHGRAPEGELVVEVPRGRPAETVLAELKRRLAARGWGDLAVALAGIPVDDRHASKVDRATLRCPKGAPVRPEEARGEPEGSATGLEGPGRSEVRAALDLSVLRYSQVWEDHRVLEQGLGVGAGDDVLSVGSAGDNVLALLLRNPRQVIAVDMSPAQIALLELKAAALRHLDHDGFARLLGARDASGEARLALFERLRLPAAARRYWEAHEDVLRSGVIWSGRLERFFAAFRTEGLPQAWPPDLPERLAKAPSLARQRALFEAEGDTFAFARLVTTFFSSDHLARAGRDPAQMRYARDHDPGALFLARFRHVCTRLPLRGNFYLQSLLTGRYFDLERGPLYLRPAAFSKLQARVDRLVVVEDEIERVVADAGVNAFSHANLSDLFEYMSEDSTERLLFALSSRLRHRGRLAYWNLLVDRRRPAHLAARLRALTSRAEALFAADRVPFYRAFRLEEVRR